MTKLSDTPDAQHVTHVTQEADTAMEPISTVLGLLRLLNKGRSGGGPLISLSNSGDIGLFQTKNQVHVGSVNINVTSSPASGILANTSQLQESLMAPRELTNRQILDAHSSISRISLPPQREFPIQQNEQISTNSISSFGDVSISPFTMGLLIVVDNENWLKADRPHQVDNQNLLIPVNAPRSLVEFQELSGERNIEIVIKDGNPYELWLGWRDGSDQPAACEVQNRSGLYAWQLSTESNISAGRSRWTLQSIVLDQPIAATGSVPLVMQFKDNIIEKVWRLVRQHEKKQDENYWLVLRKVDNNA